MGSWHIWFTCEHCFKSYVFAKFRCLHSKSFKNFFFFKDNFNPPKVGINLLPREKGEIVLSDEGREL